MKRGFAWLLTLLALLGLLSGCGGGGDTTVSDTASNAPPRMGRTTRAAPTAPGRRRKWLRTPAVRRRTVPPTVWKTPR
ncbi:MAG: hypothetical protein ACLVBB_05715 [Dysosmobacter welbionis]